MSLASSARTADSKQSRGQRNPIHPHSAHTSRRLGKQRHCAALACSAILHVGRADSEVIRTLAPAASSSSFAASRAVAGVSTPPSSKPLVASSPRMLSRQRYDSTKRSDPFSSKARFKTSFSEAYVNGRIPCRINHGSGIHQRIQWDRPSTELDYAWLLPVLADGLTETEHPYVLVARQAFLEMLAEGTQAKIAPTLPKLIQPLRRALMEPAAGVFTAGCDAVVALSQAAGPLLNEHLDLLLQQINKNSLDAKLAEKVNETIRALAENGGDAALTIIKKRVPAFTHA